MDDIDTVNLRLAGLISACADGKEAALEQLYRASSAQLFGALKRILKTDALAEEALQETFIKVWNNAGKFRRDKSAAKTWLVTIARNHAIDVLRKRKKREDVELNLDSAALEEIPNLDQSVALQHEHSQWLNVCLNELSEPARECILRAYCEGYSQEELSDHMQRPLGTVKSWIRRSLLALKECLNGHG